MPLPRNAEIEESDEEEGPSANPVERATAVVAAFPPRGQPRVFSVVHRCSCGSARDMSVDNEYCPIQAPS
eukprot:4554491-Lingulodinium_polyedra.AAC.1